jgi:hypothetical protein
MTRMLSFNVHTVSHPHRRRRSRVTDSSSDSGDSCRSEYETKKVCFKQPHRSRGKDDDDDPVALVTKLQSLSVHEPSYLVLYSHCQKRFPYMAQYIPKPQLLPVPSSSASVSYQPTSAVVPPLQPQSPTQHHPFAARKPVHAPSKAPSPAQVAPFPLTPNARATQQRYQAGRGLCPRRQT